MRSICDFSTVEDFWRYWSFMPRPSEVFYDGNTRKEIQPDGRTIDAFSMFKKGTFILLLLLLLLLQLLLLPLLLLLLLLL